MSGTSVGNPSVEGARAIRGGRAEPFRGGGGGLGGGGVFWGGGFGGGFVGVLGGGGGGFLGLGVGWGLLQRDIVHGSPRRHSLRGGKSRKVPYSDLGSWKSREVGGYSLRWLLPKTFRPK